MKKIDGDTIHLLCFIILVIAGMLLVIFGIVSCEEENRDCKKAGEIRCSKEEIQILDPYCKWEKITDCNEFGLKCIIEKEETYCE